MLAPSTLYRWICCCAMGIASAATADGLQAGAYREPVERYGHFAPGRPHEYARLVAVTGAGRVVALTLPDDEVFEDVAPRQVTLSIDEEPMLLAIVSNRVLGSRLVLVALSGDALVIAAQSPPIGTPMRWMNPVGIADLDGDGHAEIAAVVTPHGNGTLKVFRRDGTTLTEVASLGDFSNHVHGSSQLALSTIVTAGGRRWLLVPDAARTTLRVITFDGAMLTERGRCRLDDAIVGPLVAASAGAFLVTTSGGRRRIDPASCVPDATRRSPGPAAGDPT